MNVSLPPFNKSAHLITALGLNKQTLVCHMGLTSSVRDCVFKPWGN